MKEIRCYHTENKNKMKFIVGFLMFEDQKQIQCDSNNMIDHHSSSSFTEIDMDAIIDRTYTTRSVNRGYGKDAFSIEPKRNI